MLSCAPVLPVELYVILATPAAFTLLVVLATRRAGPVALLVGLGVFMMGLLLLGMCGGPNMGDPGEAIAQCAPMVLGAATVIAYLRFVRHPAAPPHAVRRAYRDL